MTIGLIHQKQYSRNTNNQMKRLHTGQMAPISLNDYDQYIKNEYFDTPSAASRGISEPNSLQSLLHLKLFPKINDDLRIAAQPEEIKTPENCSRISSSCAETLRMLQGGLTKADPIMLKQEVDHYFTSPMRISHSRSQLKLSSQPEVEMKVEPPKKKRFSKVKLKLTQHVVQFFKGQVGQKFTVKDNREKLLAFLRNSQDETIRESAHIPGRMEKRIYDVLMGLLGTFNVIRVKKLYYILGKQMRHPNTIRNRSAVRLAISKHKVMETDIVEISDD